MCTAHKKKIIHDKERIIIEYVKTEAGQHFPYTHSHKKYT